ncbi:MAG: hypothetical protein OXH31_08340 [Gammaproteobacteria bacterium]|nr:hypothetical protein [Gammaproteobacteria bacterium]
MNEKRRIRWIGSEAQALASWSIPLVFPVVLSRFMKHIVEMFFLAT